MSYRYQLGLTGLLHHLKFVSLPIFCLVDLSIGVSRVLKSLTIIVLLLISSFILISERVTGRKARGLQMEEIGCKCQTFLALLSGRRKQTSDIFFLLYTNLKGDFS